MALWQHRRLLLYPLLLLVATSIGLAFVQDSALWINRAGLLLDIAGILQLEVSGWLNSALDVYGDEERYPYGPPSSFTRHEGIIDDPDAPVKTWIKIRLFGDVQTGLYLILAGCAVQLLSTFL